MGEIRIQDTGYILPTNAGTQASSAKRANSGTVITLKTAQFTPALKRNISNQPELGQVLPGEVNLGSLENMQFQLRCILNSNNSTDMAKIQHLIKLVETDGYKLLWYDYTNATNENNNGQLIYQLALNSTFGDQLTNGEKTAFSISNNFYTLHVHFNDIQPSQQGNSNIVIYTLKGIVMKVETSTI